MTRHSFDFDGDHNFIEYEIISPRTNGQPTVVHQDNVDRLIDRLQHPELLEGLIGAYFFGLSLPEPEKVNWGRDGF